MRRNSGQIIVLLLLGFLVYLSFSLLMPKLDKSEEVPETEFSAVRAFQYVKKIAQVPHYTGSADHARVRHYIMAQLWDLGLSPHIQSGYVLNGFRVLTYAENIVVKITGTAPKPKSDLLVLAHYDSAASTAVGASDDGSGVATILESIRALKARGFRPKNTVIFCFTDAEELGLLGAHLFSKNYPGMDNVGLVINFEARGTGGPSNTILETNHGNANMVKAFAEADPEYPVANSLSYEIYKNMPNDTDATVFRENDDLPTLFFAFIDGYYFYHTAKDIPGNLDLNSLAHQGSYLMALLPYFGNHDLSHLQAKEDQVYFNFPIIDFVHYAYGWIFPLLILAWIAFFLLLVYGFRRRKLNGKAIARGFLAVVGAAVLCGLLGFFGWKLIVLAYPQYAEIQQGFPYNGHTYIVAFVAFGLFVCFGIYRRFSKPDDRTGLFVAPLFLWLLINTALAFWFKGASFFIIPVLTAELAFYFMIKKRRANLLLMLLLGIPAVFILVPLILFVPIALSMKVVFASLVLLGLIFGLLLPVFGAINFKKGLAWLALIIGIVFLVIAHFHSGFTKDFPKPNSLVYMLNSDKQTASWNTYDGILDNWTKPYFQEETDSDQNKTVFGSKYGSRLTRSVPAPLKPIPVADVLVSKDSSGQSENHYTVKIVPNRHVNLMNLKTKSGKPFKDFMANGLPVVFGSRHSKITETRSGNSTRLLTYFAVNKDTLKLSFDLPKTVRPKIELYEASYDLLHNPWLRVQPRDSTMMPRPFVLNDAIVTKQTVAL